MNDVATEIRQSKIPKAVWPFVWALCGGEGGTDADAWRRCYGGTLYTGSLTTIFDPINPLWAGKQGPAGISHALGAGQFEPGTYEETARVTGFKDIQPQSQLANIWSLMQGRYKAYTGGVVEVDIMAGKYMQVAAALKPTWASFANAAKFQKYYTQAVALFAAPAPQPTPTPVPTPIPAPTLDPEVVAMQSMLNQLSALTSDARSRVLAYLKSRLAIN